MASTSEFTATEQDIKHVRNWLVKMPHLVQDYDDEIFKSLIIACKGRLQRFKEAYEKINSLGFTYPHMYGHLDPLDEFTQYYLNNQYLFFSPEKTDDGCILIITTSRTTELDSTKYSALEMARYLFMSFLVELWEHNLGDSKFLLIYDCQNARLSEMKTITPTFLRDLGTFVNKIPIRFQGGHHIGVPPFLQKILNVLKSVLPKKLADRVHFHGSMEELYKMVPKKLLPTEFGGYAGDLDTLHNWCSYYYYQYELTTCMYMVEPWEKVVFHFVLIMMLCLIFGLSVTSWGYFPPSLEYLATCIPRPNTMIKVVTVPDIVSDHCI